MSFDGDNHHRQNRQMLVKIRQNHPILAKQNHPIFNTGQKKIIVVSHLLADFATMT